DEITKLTGNAARGKELAARCLMCHAIGGTGAELGPALDGWGRGKSAEIIARAIIRPSAEIAQGYDGTELKTTDGLTIQGLLIKEGDPLMMRSQGGFTQIIPVNRVASRRRMTDSLMLSAAQLGLTAQDVADLVAFLRAEGAWQGDADRAEGVGVAGDLPQHRQGERAPVAGDSCLTLQPHVRDGNRGCRHQQSHHRPDRLRRRRAPHEPFHRPRKDRGPCRSLRRERVRHDERRDNDRDGDARKRAYPWERNRRRLDGRAVHGGHHRPRERGGGAHLRPAGHSKIHFVSLCAPLSRCMDATAGSFRRSRWRARDNRAFSVPAGTPSTAAAAATSMS